MSVGIGLLKSLYADRTASFASLYNMGITAELFPGDEHTLFNYIERFYLDYGSLPSVETVVANTGVALDWSNLPDEPLSYWADKVRDRRLLANAAQHCDRLRAVLANGQIEEVREAIRRAYMEIEEGRALHSIKLLTEVASDVVEDHNRAQQCTDLPGIPFAFPFLNLVSGGMMGGDLITYVGRPACLAKETKLYFARKGREGSGRWYTIEDAYYKFNKIPRSGRGLGKGQTRSGSQYLWLKNIPTKTQCLKGDNLTGLSEIDSILYSGKKRLFKVTTETGKSLRTTKEHPFKVPAGTKGADSEGFKQLQFLKVGDFVVCKASKIIKTVRAKRKSYKEIGGVKYHPNANKNIIAGKVYYSIKYARLVYDAKINKIEIENFIRIVSQNKNKSATLEYSPKGLHIHHEDTDSLNDSAENLYALTNSEHGSIHNLMCNSRKHFGLNFVTAERIISIKEQGTEDTYDIIMKTPHRNYIANKFVVHNSNKSYFLLNDALHAHANGYRTMFFSMEMPLLQCGRRIISLRSKVNYARLRLGRVSYFGMDRIQQEIAEMSREIPFYLVSGGIFGTIDKFYVQVKHYRPDVVFLDGAYLMRPASGDNQGKRYEKATNVLENLKHIALAEDIPIELSYQFNRKDPGTLLGIATSDTVGQISSIVFATEHGEGHDPSNMRPVQHRIIKVLKGREGETGKVRIKLDFNTMDFTQDEIIAGVAEDFEYETADERDDQNIEQEDSFTPI